MRIVLPWALSREHPTGNPERASPKGHPDPLAPPSSAQGSKENTAGVRHPQPTAVKPQPTAGGVNDGPRAAAGASYREFFRVLVVAQVQKREQFGRAVSLGQMSHGNNLGDLHRATAHRGLSNPMTRVGVLA